MWQNGGSRLVRQFIPRRTILQDTADLLGTNTQTTGYEDVLMAQAVI